MVDVVKVDGWWDAQKLAYGRGPESFNRVVENVCGVSIATTDEEYDGALVDAAIAVLSFAMLRGITIFDVHVHEKISCNHGIMGGLVLLSRYMENGGLMLSGVPGIRMILEGLAFLASRRHKNLLDMLREEL